MPANAGHNDPNTSPACHPHLIADTNLESVQFCMKKCHYILVENKSNPICFILYNNNCNGDWFIAENLGTNVLIIS